MNPIKQRIMQFLTGEESAENEAFLTLLSEVQELVKGGIENDADALVYARKIQGKVNVIGIVGKSVLQGADLQRYLAAYFADSGGLAIHAPKVADYLYGDLKGRSDACMVLASGDRRWKAFRPLKNLDEVLAGSLDS